MGLRIALRTLWVGFQQHAGSSPTSGCALRHHAFVAQAGDMWGQYLAAQRKKEDSQHASAAKQRHPSRDAQSRPLASGAQPHIHGERKVSLSAQDITLSTYKRPTQSSHVTCLVCGLARGRRDMWQSVQSIPGAVSQKPLGAARSASARLPPPAGRSSRIARAATSGVACLKHTNHAPSRLEYIHCIDALQTSKYHSCSRSMSGCLHTLGNAQNPSLCAVHGCILTGPINTSPCSSMAIAPSSP